MLFIIITQVTMISIMWMMMYLLKFKKKSTNNKILSPFECGYNSLFSKLPMSIQFSMLVFVFLLFDIELSILISSNWKINSVNKNWLITMIFFFLFMIISICYEMMKMSFKWN